MQAIRELVSMTKNRHIEGDFNLDLTYITPRVVAMAFPAEGLESLFRNQMTEVAALLDLKHPNRYLIINASNRKYNSEKFGNRVIDMSWPNHYPCPFGHFVTVLKTSLQYLLEDPGNVLVVHCLAGKGRTGSFINALHYSSGEFKTMGDANFFYKLKRNVNVTYPSQLKYMDYFVDFFHNGLANMCFVGQRIQSLELRTANKAFLVGSYTAKISDFEKDRSLAKVKFDNVTIQDPPEGSADPRSWVEQIVPDGEWTDWYATDILIKLLNPGFFSDGRLFRLNFSMLFAVSNRLVFRPTDVDKAKGLPDDFEFVVNFCKGPEDDKSAEMRQMFESLHMDFEDLKVRMEQREFRKSLFKNLTLA